jgi:hypothetical protein
MGFSTFHDVQFQAPARTSPSSPHVETRFRFGLSTVSVGLSWRFSHFVMSSSNRQLAGQKGQKGKDLPFIIPAPVSN